MAIILTLVNGVTQCEDVYLVNLDSNIGRETLTCCSGDSNTDPGFDLDKQQPTLSLPLGNPEKAPDDAAMTWPTYLAAKYNESLLETYVFAKAGSTVDHDILQHGYSFTKQMESYYLPNYSQAWDKVYPCCQFQWNQS